MVKISKGVWVFVAFGVLVLLSRCGSETRALPSLPASAGPAPAAPRPAVRAPGKAVEAMRKSFDKVEGITWYQDRSSPTRPNVNAVYLYIGDRGPAPWLVLRLQCESSNWLFVKSALFVADGEKVGTVEGIWKRDNDTRVWEWVDVPLKPSQLALMQRLATAKEVVVRLEGTQYTRDRTLSKAELQALRSVLAAYRELGGPS